MRRAAKKDSTHEAIAHALERCGWRCLDLSREGAGVPDIWAWHPARDVWTFVEVKSPGAVPKTRRGRRSLRESAGERTRRKQAEFRSRWPTVVVESIADVVRL